MLVMAGLSCGSGRIRERGLVPCVARRRIEARGAIGASPAHRGPPARAKPGVGEEPGARGGSTTTPRGAVPGHVSPA
nr:hypothetical protein C5F59_08410 [Streptomyces sp. QL37]